MFKWLFRHKHKDVDILDIALWQQRLLERVEEYHFSGREDAALTTYQDEDDNLRIMIDDDWQQQRAFLAQQIRAMRTEQIYDRSLPASPFTEQSYDARWATLIKKR